MQEVPAVAIMRPQRNYNSYRYQGFIYSTIRINFESFSVAFKREITFGENFFITRFSKLIRLPIADPKLPNFYF